MPQRRGPARNIPFHSAAEDGTAVLETSSIKPRAGSNQAVLVLFCVMLILVVLEMPDDARTVGRSGDDPIPRTVTAAAERRPCTALAKLEATAALTQGTGDTAAPWEAAVPTKDVARTVWETNIVQEVWMLPAET